MPPGKSIRLQIMDAIEADLALILVANGARTDIGETGHVFRWKVANWREEEMPGVTFANPDTPQEDFKMRPAAVPGQRGGVFDNLMRVEFVVASGIAADDKTAAEIMEQADNAISDIEDMIRKNPKWNTLAINTLPATLGQEISQAEKLYGGARLAVVVRFRNLAFNPDTQE